MLFRDPPDHTRLRGLVNKAFTPRMVERLAPRIRKLAEELLDARAARGGMDAIADFAAPLPLLVIAELLGVPTEDRERLKRWSDDLAIMLDGTVALQFLGSAVQAAVEFDGYLRQRIAERRRAPRDDLLSELVAAQERGEALSEDEIVGSTILLLGAGHETTTNLIGNGILCLLRHPEQLARLRGDAGLLPSAVEEFLRYESPVQATSRIFPRDEVEVGGVAIPKGEEIGLFLGAANRDPEVFPDPERFDVGRRDNRHLSFGLGIHFCLGAGLARLEGRVAFEALLERAPGLRAAEESEPVWRPGFLFRGVEALPVLL
jgi:pimeloyl-[acyl-carrier protein] synthase